MDKSVINNYIENLGSKLFDPSLLQCYPELPKSRPSPPVFFKHNDKNAAARAELDDGLPEDIWGAERPFGAPRGTYKLLSSDYDWMDSPQKAKELKSGPVPDPPQELTQTKFIARARVVLVKLRQQCVEVVEGALKACAETMAEEAAMGRLRPALMDTQQQPGPAHPNAAATQAGKASKSLGHPYLDEIAEMVHVRMRSMWEDCLSDVADELWCAVQAVGASRQAVATLQTAMATRDAELETLLQTKVAAAEVKANELRAKLAASEEAMEQERVRWQGALLTSQAHVTAAQQQMAVLQSQVAERDALRAQLDAARKAFARELADKDAQITAIHEAVASRVEELRSLYRGAHSVVRERDGELEAARARLVEQLGMLGTAFKRRDVEIERTRDAEEVLREVIGLLASEGEHSLSAWVHACEESAVPGSLVPGELMNGEFGVAKALLAAARGQGAARTIKLLKSALPEYIPRYDPPEAAPPTNNSDVTAPKIIRPGDNFVRDAMPHLWLRLVQAPLTETTPLNVLCRTITELYAVKAADDEMAASMQRPTPTIHASIYKHYLAKHHNVADAEREMVILIQSVREHGLRNDRAALFSQFLALKPTVLPQAGLVVVRALNHALRTNTGTGGAVVDEDGGAVSWVPPLRLRGVMTGLLASITNATVGKMALKKISSLKPEIARSKPHFGMVDLDAGIRIAMDAWTTFYFNMLPPQLVETYRNCDTKGDGVLTVEEFKSMTENTAAPGVTVTDALSLDMMHSCLAASLAAAREGASSALGRVRGAITPAAWTAEALARGLVGTVPLPASTVEVKRLGAAVEALMAMTRAVVDGAKKEGVALGPASRTEKDLEGVARLVDAADKGSEVDEGGVMSAWATINSSMQALAQVQQAVVSKRVESMAAAAEERRVRNAEMAAEVARAKAEAEAARAERATLEAKLSETNSAKSAPKHAPAKAGGLLVSKSATSGAVHASANEPGTARQFGGDQARMSGTGTQGGASGDGVQSSSRAPGTARQTSLREQEGPGPGEGGTGGGQGTQRLSSMNSVARRAQVAEARYAALQREHAAVLGKLEELQQGAASGGAVQRRPKRRSKVRSGVTPQTSKPEEAEADARDVQDGEGREGEEDEEDSDETVQAGDDVGATIGRLLEISGHLHGMASALPPSRNASMGGWSSGGAVANAPRPSPRPHSPARLGGSGRHASGGGSAATTPPVQPPAADSHAAAGSESGGQDPLWPSLSSVMPGGGVGAPGGTARPLLQQAFNTAHPRHRQYFDGAAAGLQQAAALLPGRPGSPSLPPRPGHAPAIPPVEEGPEGEQGEEASTEEGSMRPADHNQGQDQDGAEGVPSPDALRTFAQTVTSLALEAAHLSAVAHAQAEQARLSSQELPDSAADALTLAHSDMPSASHSAAVLASATHPLPSINEAVGWRPMSATRARSRHGSMAGAAQGGGSMSARPASSSQAAAMMASALASAQASPRTYSTQDMPPDAPYLLLAESDPSRLLCRSFQLCVEEIEELGVGLMAIVQAAGGYPIITEQGAVVTQSGEVLAPCAPEDVLPDLPTQAERLRQLYVATAALVAAQHTRGGALRAAEAEVRTRLANLQSAASRLAKRAQMVGGVEARINAHLAAMAASYNQMDLASAAASALSRRLSVISDGVTTLAGHTHQSAPAQPQDGAVAAAAEPVLHSCKVSLEGAQEDLSHVCVALLDMRKAMDVWAGQGARSPRHVTPATSDLAAVETLMLELRSSASVAGHDLKYAAAILDITPSDLFQRLRSRTVSSAQLADLANGAGALPGDFGGRASLAGDHVNAGSVGAGVWLPNILPAATPSPSLHGEGSVDWLDLALSQEQRRQAAQLPPGEPLVSLSPGLMHRSELAGPRHAMRVAGRGLSPPTRPRVPSPETALRARAQAHDVVVVGGAHRYARRPYTARAYVESVMAEQTRRVLVESHFRSAGGDVPLLVRGHPGGPPRPKPEVDRPWPWLSTPVSDFVGIQDRFRSPPMDSIRRSFNSAMGSSSVRQRASTARPRLQQSPSSGAPHGGTNRDSQLPRHGGANKDAQLPKQPQMGQGGAESFGGWTDGPPILMPQLKLPTATHAALQPNIRIDSQGKVVTVLSQTSGKLPQL